MKKEMSRRRRRRKGEIIKIISRRRIRRER